MYIDNLGLFHQSQGSGVPLIVLHGGPGLDHTYLRPWLDPLATVSQLVYFDQRGQGRSRRDPAEPLTRYRWVEDIEQLRLALGFDVVMLFGHSYGGFLALDYARRFPRQICGLILCCTAARMDFPAALQNAETRATTAEFQALLAGLAAPLPDDSTLASWWRQILPLYFYRFSADMAGILDQVQFSARAFNYGTFTDIPTFDATPWLRELRMPILIIAGEHDWAMPPQSSAWSLKDALPQAELAVFAESGHLPFVEERERFIECVSTWFRSVGKAAAP
jgi:proline iminopeptidase